MKTNKYESVINQSMLLYLGIWPIFLWNINILYYFKGNKVSERSNSERKQLDFYLIEILEWLFDCVFFFVQFVNVWILQ